MSRRNGPRYVAIRDPHSQARPWLVVDLHTRTVWASCKEQDRAEGIAEALESAGATG